MKELVAQEIANRVKDGELIGVGTGSTVDIAIERIGQRVKKEGLRVRVVPSSLQTSWKCQQIGLDVLYPAYRGELDWGFDGADQVDKNLWLIKGKGGALLQEKILISRCKQFVVVVDQTKLIERLGVGCPIPVEVIPAALSIIERELPRLGASQVAVRNAQGGKHGPVITEGGNIIVDAQFDLIEKGLEKELRSIVGVVESGLFIGYTSEVLVSDQTQVRSLKP